MGTYFTSLPRLLTAPGTQHYAFSGFRHRTAEIVSFHRTSAFAPAGFDALETPLGPAAAGPLGINDGPLLEEAARVVIASPGPFSLYVMTGTSHSPWQVPPEAPMPLGNTPLGTFRYADDSIRAFVARLRAALPDFDQTLLVVIGDHIERHLRHPAAGATPLAPHPRGAPYRPARAPAGLRRRTGLRAQVDVLPTIASLLDGRPGLRRHGPGASSRPRSPPGSYPAATRRRRSTSRTASRSATA